MKFQETTSIKRVVIKGVPDRSTRLAMLKTGEADIGYLMVGVEAQTIKSDPKLRLAHVIPSATWSVEFPSSGSPNRRGTIAASACARAVDGEPAHREHDDTGGRAARDGLES